MSKLKLSKSLAQENFVKTLIQKGCCEVKEIADYADHKLHPQLVNDLMNFVESEVSKSKFAKADIEKSQIVVEIMKQCYDMSETDIQWVESHMQFLHDNSLVKKTTYFYLGLKYLARAFYTPKKD
jgi:hypothetical protein